MLESKQQTQYGILSNEILLTSLGTCKCSKTDFQKGNTQWLLCRSRETEAAGGGGGGGGGGWRKEAGS